MIVYHKEAVMGELMFVIGLILIIKGFIGTAAKAVGLDKAYKKGLVKLRHGTKWLIGLAFKKVFRFIRWIVPLIVKRINDWLHTP